MKSKKANIRKQQSILLYSGLAIILFGVWSIAKVVLMRFIDPDHFEDYFGFIEEVPAPAYLNIVFAAAILVLLIELLLRTYIGLSAIQEGRGKLRNRITYIIIALVFLIVAIVSDVADIIIHFIDNDYYSLEIFLTTIIDMSIHIATLEVIVAAIRIRKLIREK